LPAVDSRLPLRKEPGVERKLNETVGEENAHKFGFAFAIGNTNGKMVGKAKEMHSVLGKIFINISLFI